MRYLVAGGAGFIGHHMVKRLVSEDFHGPKLLPNTNEVTVVDNYCTGSKKNHVRSKQVKYILDDICDYRDNHKYDRIINLACPASPVAYQSTPIQTWLTSVQGVYNLLGLAHLCGARFLQASTSEVYGDPTVHPQKETYWGNVNSYGPRACYDEGKRAAESLIYDFQRVAQSDCRIVRIFNTYGPNMAENDGRVVSNFIMQAIQNKPITIYGDGSQTRSFCYVEDTVEAILRVLEGSYSQPLNVGNPKENTMLELAAAVIGLTKSKSKIISMTLPENDPRQRCPDISKIKELYWWAPNTELEQGLRKTIAYFRALQLKK